MPVTQGDVAALAGVARRTVSNVVNGFPYVSDNVRARVQAAIDQLGYKPNRAAQYLRTGRSGILGLILPELDVGYFAEIARLLVEEAERRGYTVLIAQTLGLADREVEVLDQFANQQPDGLIFSPISIDADTLADRIRDTPLVLLGEHLAETPRDHVAIDNVAATQAVMQHLIDTGRRAIAFIGHAGRPGALNMADLRLRGYTEALEANGLTADRRLIRAVDGYHRVQGYDAQRELLETGVSFDAVCCATDLLAIGAMRALADGSIAIPDDVAVVGFDDLDEGRFAVPRLTTVAPNKASIARAAIDLVITRINGVADPEHHLGKDDYSVEIRESSLARPEQATSLMSAAGRALVS